MIVARVTKNKKHYFLKKSLLRVSKLSIDGNDFKRVLKSSSTLMFVRSRSTNGPLEPVPPRGLRSSESEPQTAEQGRRSQMRLPSPSVTWHRQPPGLPHSCCSIVCTKAPAHCPLCECVCVRAHALGACVCVHVCVCVRGCAMEAGRGQINRLYENTYASVLILTQIPKTAETSLWRENVDGERSGDSSSGHWTGLCVLGVVPGSGPWCLQP